MKFSTEILLQMFNETLTYEITKQRLEEKPEMTIDEFMAIMTSEMKEHEEDYQ